MLWLGTDLRGAKHTFPPSKLQLHAVSLVRRLSCCRLILITRVHKQTETSDSLLAGDSPERLRMGPLDHSCRTSGPFLWDFWTILVGPLDHSRGTSGPFLWDLWTILVGPEAILVGLLDHSCWTCEPFLWDL